MAFLYFLFACQNSIRNINSSTTKRPRRAFLRIAGLTSFTALVGYLPAQSEEANKLTSGKKEWKPEELCNSCEGRGKQTCSLCEGSGIYRVDDNVVLQDNICPNCQGVGNVKCPACIGLGLADVKGILRNGARDGTLRMLRDGRYEILDCTAFPSCDIYGGERRS